LPSVCRSQQMVPSVEPSSTTEGSGHLVTVLFETHAAATGFLADSLFAWAALAAVLLVPYQSRHPFLKRKDAVIRGFAWE
jgi:hypothetical protein